MALLTYGKIDTNKPSWYLGATVETATKINAVITGSNSSGNIPCSVHVSIEGTSIDGSDKYYGYIECSWDFGDSDNQRTATDQFGKSVNLNNEQVGREASYVYMKPGTYTITGRFRLWNGSEFLESSAAYIVTVGDIPSNALRMYISNAGNDSNDGNDPNGFALTSGSWNSSTKTLTSSGSFTSYDHSLATSPIYDLQKSNIIYLSGGTSVVSGWYKILSKIDNDSVVLDREITSNNSNPTNVTSSNGTKSSYSSIRTFINGATSTEMRYCFLRGGDSFTVDSSISISRVGRRMICYGDNYQSFATLNVSPSLNVPIFNGNIPQNYFYSDYVFLGIIMNCAASASAYHMSLTSSGSGGNIAAFTRICFIDCSFLNNSTGIPCVNCANIQSVKEKTQMFLFLGCIFNNPNISKSHLFINGGKWIAFVGCSFSGGNGSITLDHYIYPNDWENRLFAYCNFGAANSLGYAINNNVDNTSPTRRYVDIRNNFFTGPNFGVDFSNSNNSDLFAKFDEYFCGDNVFKNLPRSPLLGYNVKRIYVARNLFIGIPGNFPAVNVGSSTDFDIDMWDNKSYRATLSASQGALFSGNITASPVTGHITGNSYKIGNNDGVFGEIRTATTPNIIWDKNNFTGSGATPYYDFTTNTERSISQWQATGRDLDLDTSDPNWVDPANGIFLGGLLSLCNLNNKVLSLDGGTINHTNFIKDEPYVDKYRIYNSGDKVLITDTSGITISGNGSGGSSGQKTLYPGEYVEFYVSKNTSALGNRNYSVNINHDGVNSPFSVTVNFTTIEDPLSGEIFSRYYGGQSLNGFIDILFGGNSDSLFDYTVFGGNSIFEDTPPPIQAKTIIELMNEKVTKEVCWPKFNKKYEYFLFLKEFSNTPSFYKPSDLPVEPRPSDVDCF